VRTPLNAIINYLEIALEGPLDQETRDNLARSHTASKSLIYVINDLLDLTRTEGGHDLVREEILDLRKTIHEATDVFKADAERKKISFEIVELSDLPALVKGDPARLRQVISNITANAIAYTVEGGVRIEVWACDFDNEKCTVGIAVDDTGVGMTATDLDTLFQELEQVRTEEEDMEQSGKGQDPNAPIHAFPKVPSQKMLGLGLAVVARSIWNMNGQLRLKSKEGDGSRFTICVPLLLQNTAEEGGSKSMDPIIPPPAGLGELTLSHPPSVTKRRSSDGSQGSAGSRRSEIERIAHAISSPPLPEEPASQVPPTGCAGPPSPTRPQTATTPAPDRSEVDPELASGNVALMGPAKVPDDGVALAATSSISASPQSSPLEAKQAPSPGPNPAPSKFTVLVAEDDPINSKIIKKRLEKMGHDVVLTVNGEECLEKFSEAGEEYDVVLMDMQACCPSPFSRWVY
jgi:CheY-like chemotaxis protein